LKRLNNQLGIEIEKRRVVSKACDWLKEKASLGPSDFVFDDEEIKAAMIGEDNHLKSENAELSRQIEALEGERTKLLSQLRERAVEIGDKGVRFLGMNSQQVAQIMEFSQNIRKGTIELPLNDRSKELLSAMAALKSQREIDKVTIERLEREMFSLSAASNEPHGGESIVIKRALNDLTNENLKLRSDIDVLKMDAEQRNNEQLVDEVVVDAPKSKPGANKQALPGGQVQTPLGPGDEAWRKEQERKGGVQWFLQKTWLS